MAGAWRLRLVLGLVLLAVARAADGEAAASGSDEAHVALRAGRAIARRPAHQHQHKGAAARRRAHMASVLEERAHGLLTGSSGILSQPEMLGQDWERDLATDDDDRLADTVKKYQKQALKGTLGVGKRETLPKLQDEKDFEADFPFDDSESEIQVEKDAKREAKHEKDDKVESEEKDAKRVDEAKREAAKAEAAKEAAAKKAKVAAAKKKVDAAAAELAKAKAAANAEKDKAKPLAKDFKQKHEVALAAKREYEETRASAETLSLKKDNLTKEAEAALGKARRAGKELKKILDEFEGAQREVSLKEEASMNKTSEASAARKRLDKELAAVRARQRDTEESQRDVEAAEAQLEAASGDHAGSRRNQGKRAVAGPPGALLLALLGGGLAYFG